MNEVPSFFHFGGRDAQEGDVSSVTASTISCSSVRHDYADARTRKPMSESARLSPSDDVVYGWVAIANTSAMLSACPCSRRSPAASSPRAAVNDACMPATMPSQ